MTGAELARLEKETNLVVGLRTECSGLDHAFLLGAQYALEWSSGISKRTPTDRFLELQNLHWQVSS